MVYSLPRSTDMPWERHINCQKIKVVGQANGTLQIFKLLPWLPGVVYIARSTGHLEKTFRITKSIN